MKEAKPIKIGPLKHTELTEADRIFRLAFATFMGLPDPSAFWGGREVFKPRWDAPHVTSFAARDEGRLIGSNMLTRWGSFAFLGPLTVLPDYWNRGVAQLLLDATAKTFAKLGLKRTGLFTFPHSTKHLGLYQKFGYWPGYLTVAYGVHAGRTARRGRKGGSPQCLAERRAGSCHRGLRKAYGQD